MTDQLVYQVRTSRALAKWHRAGVFWEDSAACSSALPLDTSNSLRPAEVPAELRCQQLACRPAWADQ